MKRKVIAGTLPLATSVSLTVLLPGVPAKESSPSATPTPTQQFPTGLQVVAWSGRLFPRLGRVHHFPARLRSCRTNRVRPPSKAGLAWNAGPAHSWAYVDLSESFHLLFSACKTGPVLPSLEDSCEDRMREYVCSKVLEQKRCSNKCVSE